MSVKVFGQNYTLKTVPVRNELNTALITSQPFTDRDGFVWFAVNNEGVFCKFDGRNQTQYSTENIDRERITISNSSIYSWVQDKNGKIWAINLVGAYIINPKKANVKQILWKTNENLKDFECVASILDNKGNIWISVGDEYIIRVDKNYRQKFYKLPASYKEKKYIKNIKENFYGNKITLKVLKQLPDGKILIQSYYGIYVIDEKGIHLLISIKNPNLPIHFSENGRIFKKDYSGFYLFDNKKYNYNYIKEIEMQMFTYPFPNFLFKEMKIFSADGKNVYIAQLNKGRSSFAITDTLSFKVNIFNDHLSLGKDSIIWFSTYHNIFMLKANNGRFKKHLQFTERQVSTRSLVSDRAGNLYVGSYSGLFKLDERRESFSQVYDSDYSLNYYNSFFIENDSILWSDGEANFIKSINLNTKKVKTIVYKGNENFRSIFIKEKSRDSLWIGTDKGLFTFDKILRKFDKYKIGQFNANNIDVQDLLKKNNGDLWIATNKGLYFKGRGKEFIDYASTFTFFKNKNILVLCEDKNRNLWVGTNNSGVAYLNFKTGKIEIYNQSNGLSNNTVCGILENNGQMWFSTFYGLSVLDKSTRKFYNYYLEDGISDNEFNRRSFYKKNSNTFYFGGLNGITELNPNDFSFARKNNKIFLSKSEYFAKSKNKYIVDYKNDFNSIELPHDKNYFSAEFSINDMYNYKRSTYYYRIKGITDRWINSGNSGLVKLYNLPAGKYLLEVKGKNFEGFETINQIKIRIHVEQVFFKTPYFISFLILLGVFLIIFEFKRKTKKQKKIFEKEKEIITLKANALKAQMNPHFVFNILNNMQSIMILKGEAEANKYFGAFSRLIRLTLDISKQELVSLEDELRYINYYLILNNLQLNNHLDFSIISDDIKNKENLFIPGMLIQPFVENAIIHGLSPKENGDKVIQIRCYIENDLLIVVIEDNGIGRAAAAKLTKNREYVYKSWSTTIVKERINIINSSSSKQKISLEIEDQKSEGWSSGTTVTIKFKI